MTIDYFIQASDSSGRTQKDPFTAPLGYYTITYETSNRVEEQIPPVNTPDVQFRSSVSERILEVEFSIPEMTKVSIGIFDVTGREVVQLCGGSFSAGTHVFTRDLDDFSRVNTLSAGRYFVFARIGKNSFSEKIFFYR